MPNSAAEVLQVKNAVALIAKRFQPYLIGHRDLLALLGTPSVERFSTTIKFMDQAPFHTNLRTANFRPGRQRGGCTTNGFTTWMHGTPTIFINRTVARPATIIHELLHLLTHASFFGKFGAQPAVVEGMTEHFTRLVQQATRQTDRAEFSQFCKSLSPRRGIYAAEAKAINQVDKQKLASAAKISHVMEQAFFKGDPDALQAVELALQRPEWFSRDPTS